MAFDTIYAEGQRRYVESLSAYARQFLGQMDKPDVDFIEGLSPAISIDQKSASRNPRSTVGTITEVYDYLRLLFARIGVPHCPNDGTKVSRQTPQQIVDRVMQLPEGTRFQVLAPVVRGRKGEYESLLADLAAQGFARGPSRRRGRRDRGLLEGRRPVGALRAAQHPSRGRPIGATRQHRAPAHRLPRDRTPTRRRRGRDRARLSRRRRERDPHVQSAPRVPRLRHVVRGTGAPQLLVQLAVRRVRALRRPRHHVRGRPRVGRSEPRYLRGRGRDLAVVDGPHPVLQPHARSGRRGARHRPDDSVGQVAEGATRLAAVRHRRASRSPFATRTATAVSAPSPPPTRA